MSTRRFEYLLSLSTKGWNQLNRAQVGMRAFNKEVGSGNRLMDAARGQVTALVGAYVGFNALQNTANIIKGADTAAFGLEASLRAANREFDNVGGAEQWEETIGRLSAKLRIYSRSDLRTAAASTVDMTKRLGFSASQMEQLIALTADLSAGRTDLAGGIERVTAAMRGEAEASEYLGLTLNETYVKSWYEARGAMQGAWKDLDDLQKVQIRYMVFLEQAAPLQNKAADSVETFAGALALVKAKIHDAIGENEGMVEVTRDLARYLEDNSGALGEMVTQLMNGAVEITRWVVENRELIATSGKWAAAIWLVIKALTIATTTVKGLQAASLAMTGAGLVEWLVKMRTGFLALEGAAVLGGVSMTGAFGLAVIAAYSLTRAIDLNIARYRELKQLKQDIADLEAENGRGQEELASRFREISDATGVTVKSMEELDQAVKDGLLHYDEATASWVAGAGKMSAAVEKSVSIQETVTKEKLDEMKAAYEKYVSAIKTLQDQIAGREKSLASELREMGRTGMSDLGAWQDRKREAEDYYAASEKALAMARTALAAGDEETAAFRFKEATEYADSAKEAYKSLNSEVKSGDKTIISQQAALKKAMAGVEDSGQLAIAILKEQKEAARKAADELNRQADGTLGEDHLKEITGLTVEYQQEVKKTTTHWEAQWETVEKDGRRTLQTIAGEIDKLSGKTIDVAVKYVEKKSGGGLPLHFAGGGTPAYFRRLTNPYIARGYGAGDDVPALLKRTEFVQPPNAVRMYGLRFMELVRRGLFPVEMARGFADGGTPAGPVSLAGAAVGGSTVYNLNFNFIGSAPVATRQNARDLARQVLTEFQKMHTRSS